MPWTCDFCGRQFGRRNQSHECEPGRSLEAWFEDYPPAYREIYTRIAKHLATLGPTVVDALDVGILIKRSRTFAELRPKKKALALSVLLSRRHDHPRVKRIIQTSSSRFALFVDLVDADDVDKQVLAWVEESYLDSPL